jgi:2-iminobutanoate/2-iminopropanoate deaminase
MKLYQISIASTALVVAGFFPITGATAADVSHSQENAKAPYASSVAVPPGYTTYYISGSPGRGNDTVEQTTLVLANLKEQLGKLGMTFADVVQAHVFLVGDPANGGKMDFAGMNSVWMKEFGTADQPNKPARAAFQVAGIAGNNTLIEIELIAVKKAN